jgi:hypothetical protein
MPNSEAESPRTTAMGLLTDAKHMLRAAEILEASGEWSVNSPTYYLLGHALEEAMKSWLLATGIFGLDYLKFKLGHDLSKAAKLVVECGEPPLSILLAENLPYIELLNVEYLSKQLEYRKTGAVSRPPIEVLISLLRSMILTIEPIALAALPHR